MRYNSMRRIQQYEADTNGKLSPAFRSTSNDVYLNPGGDGDVGFSAEIGKLAVGTNVIIEHGKTSYVAWLNHIDIYVDRTCAPTGSQALGVSTGSYAVTTRLSSGNYYCASV